MKQNSVEYKRYSKQMFDTSLQETIFGRRVGIFTRSKRQSRVLVKTTRKLNRTEDHLQKRCLSPIVVHLSSYRCGTRWSNRLDKLATNRSIPDTTVADLIEHCPRTSQRMTWMARGKKLKFQFSSAKKKVLPRVPGSCSVARKHSLTNNNDP